MKKAFLTDESIMPFGRYHREGLTMEEVPASYLLWLRNEWKDRKEPLNPVQRSVSAYIEDNIDVLRKQRAEDHSFNSLKSKTSADVDKDL